MGDENEIPPSKKRAAGRELSRDNPGLDDDEDVPEDVAGTFKRATDEVLASRRIVKVRRQQNSAACSAPSCNPFAGIRLVPPAPVEASTEAGGEKTNGEEVDQKTETIQESWKESGLNENRSVNKTADVTVESAAVKEKVYGVEKEAEVNSTDKNEAADKASEFKQFDKKEIDGSVDGTEEAKPTDSEEAGGDEVENDGKKDNANPDTAAQPAPLNSFQQLSSSQNAFTGLAGTGFASSTFSFGSIPKDGSPSGSGFLFGSKADQPSIPSFSFGASNNGSTPLFSNTGASAGTKSEGSGFPSMQEVPMETGEENEETVFTADSVLFEYLDGGWKERGKGEVKVNVSIPEKEKARLVMRARGNYRLILNAYIYPDMKLTNMDKRGITFACMNSATDGKKGLSTFALKFKDVSVVEAFSAAVTAHKGKVALVLKTPENSPRASDD
ncbi:hypothetical protein Ancab_029461 [Ancistrocladus abbreviatus]